jgi:hypothetical protein
MSGKDSIYIINDINFESEQCDNYVNFIERYNENGIIILNDKKDEFTIERIQWVTRILLEIQDKVRTIADMVRENLGLTIYGDPGYVFQRIEGNGSLCIDGVKPSALKEIDHDKIRCLTVIAALNDFDSKTDLYFPKQDVSIKLKKGEFVVFPPYWTHPYKIRTDDPQKMTYILKTWMFGE